MQEKRRFRRMNIEVQVSMEHLNETYDGTGEKVLVDVRDVSRNGMSFVCDRQLEMYACFAVDMKLWNGEGMHTIIKIVRGAMTESGYEYGCIFVGLTDVDEFRIQVHEILDTYAEE